ncbi:hypothetical protein NP233_g5022 [Leucocoprinus birnbaumii]|uniref:Uncharacterized protein n=1 Tax=Leucocoprinus birnbaumii TaxID=56174 RepID=A0AAD5VU28_9AGAR|nr:hypothetical protein NP233_g5022 [Leucocoprinus birnbaumii]
MSSEGAITYWDGHEKSRIEAAQRKNQTYWDSRGRGSIWAVGQVDESTQVAEVGTTSRENLNSVITHSSPEVINIETEISSAQPLTRVDKGALFPGRPTEDNQDQPRSAFEEVQESSGPTSLGTQQIGLSKDPLHRAVELFDNDDDSEITNAALSSDFREEQSRNIGVVGQPQEYDAGYRRNQPILGNNWRKGDPLPFDPDIAESSGIAFRSTGVLPEIRYLDEKTWSKKEKTKQWKIDREHALQFGQTAYKKYHVARNGRIYYIGQSWQPVKGRCSGCIKAGLLCWQTSQEITTSRESGTQNHTGSEVQIRRAQGYRVPELNDEALWRRLGVSPEDEALVMKWTEPSTPEHLGAGIPETFWLMRLPHRDTFKTLKLSIQSCDTYENGKWEEKIGFYKGWSGDKVKFFTQESGLLLLPFYYVRPVHPTGLLLIHRVLRKTHNLFVALMTNGIKRQTLRPSLSNHRLDSLREMAYGLRGSEPPAKNLNPGHHLKRRLVGRAARTTSIMHSGFEGKPLEELLGSPQAKVASCSSEIEMTHIIAAGQSS